MTAPTPKQFEKTIAQSLARLSEMYERIRADLQALPRRYEDAYEAAGWPARRENAGKISSRSGSDPTAAVNGDPYDPEHLGSYNRLKGVLEKLPAKCMTAENVVGSIADSIDRAMDVLSPRAEFGDAVQMDGGGATREQLREALSAAERRAERGEGQPGDGRTASLRVELARKANP